MISPEDSGRCKRSGVVFGGRQRMLCCFGRGRNVVLIAPESAETLSVGFYRRDWRGAHVNVYGLPTQAELHRVQAPSDSNES